MEALPHDQLLARVLIITVLFLFPIFVGEEPEDEIDQRTSHIPMTDLLSPAVSLSAEGGSEEWTREEAEPAPDLLKAAGI